MDLQKKVVAILFLIAVILLAAIIVIGKVYKVDSTSSTSNNLTGFEIDSLFKVSISNFGLDSSSLKKAKIKNISGDSIFAKYSLDLPSDIPSPIFLQELNNIFEDYNIQYDAFESKIRGKSTLLISSEDYMKLAVEININKTIVRKKPSLAFLIELNDPQQKSLEQISNFSEPFSVLLTPSEIAKNFLPSLQKINRNYAILIGDDQNDLNYKISSSYSEKRLKSSISTIVGTFSKATFFVIDDNSNLYKSKIFSFVKKEFDKRKLHFVNKSSLISFYGSITGTNNEFKEMALGLDSEAKLVYVMKPETFEDILTTIKELRKIGFHYVHPPEILLNIL